MAVAFNPAQHGGVMEDYRNVSRSGTMWFIFGVFTLLLASLFFYLWIFRDSISTIVQAGFWISLGVAILFIALGAGNMADASAFRAKVRYLTTPGNGLVVRGSIKGVRNRYALWGRTWGVQAGDSLGGADTGWYYKVDYVFEPKEGKLRKATGIIPDLLGPNRRNNTATTFIDPNMPRIGMRVDVLFAQDKSVILRIMPPT